MADEIKLPLACARCNRAVQCKPTTAGNPRPPVGWTLVDATDYWCSDCWDEVYVPRAVTVGVQPDDWGSFRAALRATMGACRSIANWAYSRLYNSDI